MLTAGQKRKSGEPTPCTRPEKLRNGLQNVVGAPKLSAAAAAVVQAARRAASHGNAKLKLARNEFPPQQPPISANKVTKVVRVAVAAADPSDRFTTWAPPGWWQRNLCVCVWVGGWVCVCVYHLNRCKTSMFCRGHGSCFPSHANEAMGLSRKGAWTHAPVPAIYIYIYIYIYIVPPLGAYKSQLGGTYILSLLVYTVNVSCDLIYIYIYIYVFSSFHFYWLVSVTRLGHSTSKFGKLFRFKCVCMRSCVTGSVPKKVCA